MEPRQSWWDTTINNTPTQRIQGGSRHTYQTPHNTSQSQIFLETDGRPLNTEIELWDGPNNTPTKLKVYSEDGRLRPVNAMIDNPLKEGGYRGSNSVSVRNVGTMEFPINAGVSNVVGSGNNGGRSDMQQFRTGGSSSSLAGREAAGGGYLTANDVNGYTRPTPTSSSSNKKRPKRIQGGALETFPLDYSIEAVQITLTTQGLPMNAKVELWGTSSHIKQVAEIYNDNGATRPFAAIVDTPGGSNTIAIYNTGPMEYPVEALVEPVARREDWDGKEEKFGGSLAPW